MAILTTGVVAPLWLASGFGGLDGSLAVMFAKDC